MAPLVLSLFPGVGMLDKAFEAEGFCVVRGPDVLWGGDIRGWHPPVGRVDGVIGGPPCQCFSRLRTLNPLAGKKVKNLVPEFSRVVSEARSVWFLMENVTGADSPETPAYAVSTCDVRDVDVGGYTKRTRRFWFGMRDRRTPVSLEVTGFPQILTPARTVTRNVRIPGRKHFAKAKARGGGVLPGDGRYASIAEICELQGLPGTFPRNGPFRVSALRVMLGNGVPLAMGRAIAKAVRRATE